MRHVVVAVVGLSVLVPLAAQPKAGFALPQAPTLSGPPTLGMRRGTMAEITLPGTNLADAVAIYTTAPGVTAIIHPGQTDPTKLKMTLAAATEGPIGLFQIRLATKHGVSNFRPFCLDDLPEVAKTGDISKKEKAQVLAWPCVVTGGVAPEAADYYKVAVKPGQKLMLEVLARRIGSPTDPVIILHDAKTLRELPALYADDTPGLQGDCRLAVPNKESREFLVEVRDMTYQGGPAHGYRLRVGEFPVAATAFPLDAAVGPFGEQAFVRGAVFPSVVYLSPKEADGPRGWPVAVTVFEVPAWVEHEPNDTPDTANPIPVPGGMSAGFTKKGDKDHFRFAAKKGTKYVVEAMTGELGAATEVYIRILDKAGKEMAASDPQKVKAQVEVTAAEDGPLVIACEHLLYLSGPNEVYFLTVKEAKPDFEVILGTDRVDVPAGGVGVMPIVGLNRLNGFSGRVHVLALKEPRGAEGTLGAVTIPAGVTPTPEKPVLLPVKWNGDRPPGPMAISVVGSNDETEKEAIFRPATAVETVKAALANLYYTPMEMHSQFVAGVYDPRVMLTLPQDAITLKPGEKATVTVERSPKAAEPAGASAVAGGAATRAGPGDLTYTAVNLPAGVTMTAKGDELTLACDAKAVAGTGRLVIRGQFVKAKGKEKEPDYAVLGVGGEITVQSEVKKEPAKKK